MKTVNSISGGKTSAYLAKFYPADINVFSLVRIEDRECLWMEGKDESTRQLISDRLGVEFIGTAEMDDIIYTILDLEQFLGQEIKILTGDTFEQVILNHSNYLPNQMARFCTSDMKIRPIFDYIQSLDILPVNMQIGFRPNEISRADNVKSREKEDGFEYMRTIIGHKKGRNQWGEIKYRKVQFPLITDNITKDVIYNYWFGKPVRFAYRNNCVGCVNRQPLMISHMATKERHKIEWFAKQERRTGNRFLKGVTFDEILKFHQQGSLFNDDEFNDFDSGFCGL
jgi:hypothetical protein